MTVEQEPASPRSNGGLSQVTVTINGRRFRMACEDGQESHLQRLAADLDQRIEQLRHEFGEIGSTRLTIMAALTLADELVEMGERLRAVEQELAALMDARAVAAEHAHVTQTAVAAALNAAAARIETITRRLNRTRPPEAAPLAQGPAGPNGPMGLAGVGGLAGAAVSGHAPKPEQAGGKWAAEKLADAEFRDAEPADEELEKDDMDAEVGEDEDEDEEVDEEVDEDAEADEDDFDEDELDEGEEVDEDDFDEDEELDEDDAEEDDDEKPASNGKPASRK